MIGQTISHYKILEKLGEGGMGIVYKGEDLKLHRQVAIKFLPRQLSAHGEERERFAHEAQAASALNHPNVATIYEIDEAQDETFIVMEYVEGQTLREKKAGLTIKQAVDTGMQIAEGLAAAHERGIVHRDVKAENIMVRKDGRVQIMDFGLAKLRGVSRLTKAGSTVGTMAYMSPEQVQGIETDHRTDIFSLGVVLYELITEQLPFKGGHEAALMYEVLNVDPPAPSSLRREVEPELERIILKCLEKDREERYQSVKDVAVDLKRFKRDSEGKRIQRAAITREAEKASEGLAPVAEKLRISAFPGWLKYGGAAAVLVIAGLVLLLLMARQETPTPVINSTYPLTTAPGLETSPTWSPDGRRIAYSSDESGNADIWVQQLAAGQKVNLTEDHRGDDWSPVWSPDGEWIAFISVRDGGGVFVMSALGGTPRPVHKSSSDLGLPHSISWSSDGTKIGLGIEADVYTVAEVGGTPERISLESTAYSFRLTAPMWNLDGRRIAYTDVAGAGLTTSKIWTVRNDGTDPIAVTDGTNFDHHPVWSPDGEVLFFISDRGGNSDIWWVPINSRGKPTGRPKAITFGAGVDAIALSADGRRIAYSKAVGHSNIWTMPIPRDRTLTLRDAEPITSEKYYIETIAVSPDREWIAFESNRTGNMDLWIMRKDGEMLRQITTNKAHDWSPDWSPDGQQIAFHSMRTGNREIFTLPVEGGPALQLTNHPAKDWIPWWSPVGDMIAFTSDRSGTMEVWTVSSEGGEAQQLTDGGNFGSSTVWAPDGSQLVLHSDRPGQAELFLISSEGGEPIQLTHGGWISIFPGIWTANGQTIYAAGQRSSGSGTNNIWAISVADGSARQLTDFRETTKQLQWISSDGKRFYLVLGESIGDIWVAELSAGG